MNSAVGKNAMQRADGSPEDAIQVLVMSDHPMMRTVLHVLIEKQPGMHVVGEAANTADLRTSARERLDVILIDLDSYSDLSLNALRQLFGAADLGRVLILTSIRDSGFYRRAVRLGALGVLDKDVPMEILVKAIEKVCAGEIWLDRSTMASLLRETSVARRARASGSDGERIAALTRREREVVKLIARGLKTDEVADNLFISQITVRHHLSSVFGKLGVKDRLGLLLYAYRHDLADPPV